MNKIPLSVIILTLDEEENIVSCLDSVHDWADEIFLVDSGSTDQTLELASRFTDKIFNHPFENYSQQRNWAQDNLPLSHTWLFHIDADERVTPELVVELRKFFSDERLVREMAGLLVRRRIEFLGRHIKHGGIYPTYHCRIFRRECGRCEEREYDQHFLVEGPTEVLEADLIEVTASSLSLWTTRHNRWAQMEARFIHEASAGKKSSRVEGKVSGNPIERRRWLKASVYESIPLFLRAFVYFLLRYIVRAGFLDGTPGLIYHVLHGFWFRFYIDACYYELQREATRT